jgi:two-component system LytT family sensor kinase
MPATLLALLAGLGIGWLDVHATEVQGPLLLLMLAAFIIALLSRSPAWRVALAVSLGLPLAHLIANAMGSGGTPQWGMLIAVVPALLAAYGGKGVATLLGSTTSALSQEADPPSVTAAWLERPASPAQLLGTALLGCCVVGAVPVYAIAVARGQPNAWWVATWWQVVSFLAWALAAPLVLRLWRRLRRDDADGVTPLEIMTHLSVVSAIAVVHAIVLPLLTLVLFVPLGPGGVVRAATWALAAYLPLDLLTYCLIIGLGHASDANRRAHAASKREATIRGELSTARLASLTAQLRPHFLFNALNAATVLARRGDAESAVRVLTRLADLLRYVLRGAEEVSSARNDLVRLDDELTFAESYLAIERERFPDRLATAFEVTSDARVALVPHLLIQPLVENAVKHGIGGRIGPGLVTIRAWRVNVLLHVTVEDDGPGPVAVESQPHGIGLSNTRARLATIYGDDAQLTLEPRRGGGALARVILPYRE